MLLIHFGVDNVCFQINLFRDIDPKKWDDIEIIQKQLGFVNSADGMDPGLKPLTARECFVRHFMTEREAEYTDIETVK